MLDIIEFDNMDVIIMSGVTGDEEGDNNETIVPTNEQLSEGQTSGTDENAGPAVTAQDSEESSDGAGVLASQEEDSTEPEQNTDIDEPTGEPEPNTDIDEPTGEPDIQSDDGLL